MGSESFVRVPDSTARAGARGRPFAGLALTGPSPSRGRARPGRTSGTPGAASSEAVR